MPATPARQQVLPQFVRAGYCEVVFLLPIGVLLRLPAIGVLLRSTAAIRGPRISWAGRAPTPRTTRSPSVPCGLFDDLSIFEM